MNNYTLHFDGSCGPKNPGGTAAWGFKLRLPSGDVYTDHGIIGTGPEMSNNLAEFTALAKGLDKCSYERPARNDLINVYGDSQVVIHIMSGQWKAGSNKLYQPAYEQARAWTKELRRRGVIINFFWIRREQNAECDRLSKAYQIGRK